MDIRKLLHERKLLIDKKLNEILPGESIPPKKLHKAIRYSVFSGGKRIRPILAIEGCLCCGGKIADCIDAARAIELVHTFSLVHDDLPGMDNDDYRRGKLACHKKFDEATAILAGDALIALAFEIIARGKRPAVETGLIREFARSIGSLGIAGGQCMDIERGSPPDGKAGKKKDEKILNYINSKKTGEFIKVSLKMGAISSGADYKKIRQLEKFGGYIGEAFQIIDDILDNGDSVRVLGRNAAIKRAGLLTGKAKVALKVFKGKADTLKKIADYLAERKL